MGMTEKEIAAAQARMHTASQGGSKGAADSTMENGGDKLEQDAAVQKPTWLDHIRKRKWLQIAMGLLAAIVVAAVVQAAATPFLDPDSDRYVALRLMIAVFTMAAVMYFVPDIDEQPTWLRAIAFNGLSVGVFGLAAYLVLIATLRVENHIQTTHLASAAEQQAVADAAELAAIQIHVQELLNEFALPISESECQWDEFADWFNYVSDREWVLKDLNKRKAHLAECLSKELQTNLETLVKLVTEGLGGNATWQKAEQSPSSWEEFVQRLRFDVSSRVCNDWCRGEIAKHKKKVVEVAQTQHGRYTRQKNKYLENVVKPAVREMDEIDRKIDRRQAQEAADAAREPIMIGRDDGGFSEMMNGIFTATDRMVRQTESSSSRYQRMVNEEYQRQGAKRYWAAYDGITLDSETREPDEEGEGVVAEEMGHATGVTKHEYCPVFTCGAFCPGKPHNSAEPLYPAECARQKQRCDAKYQNYLGSLSAHCRAKLEERKAREGRPTKGRQK